MRTFVFENRGLLLTAIGGFIGAWVAIGLLGDKGVGGLAIVTTAIGACVGLLCAARIGGARG